MIKKAFNAVIRKNPDMDAAYVAMPFDLKAETGKGRLRVDATFDGIPYSGSIVNMGVRNPDGTVCYILGLPKSVRRKLGKTFGEIVEVSVEEALV